MTLYLVTFDLHGASQPPGNLYTDIYSDIRKQFQAVNYCKDFGQICLVRSDDDVAAVKNRVKAIMDRYGNQFSTRDIVVFSVGEEISISRGSKDEELRRFRQFFRSPRNASEYDDSDKRFY